jgi:hypothetical protein
MKVNSRCCTEFVLPLDQTHITNVNQTKPHAQIRKHFPCCGPALDCPD